MTDTLDPNAIATAISDKVGTAIQQLINKFTGAVPIINTATQAMQNFGKAAQLSQDVIKSVESYSDILQDLVPSSKELRDGTVQLGGSFDIVADGIAKLAMMTTNFHGFDNMVQNGDYAVNTIDKQFNELLNNFGSWGKASEALLGAGFSKIAGMSVDVAQKFFANAASAQKLENSYMNLLGATGQLGSVFKNGFIDGKLSDNVGRFANSLTQTAQITGQTTGEVSKFASELYAIPNTMNQFIELGGDKHMESLTASITAARGAGHSLNTVLATMRTAYEDLGNAQGPVNDNAAKGIALFSLMSETSNKLGLRFADTSAYLTGVAQTFKFSGDNSRAAAEILSRYSSALQSTGLTAKASVDIIGGMTSAIDKLSTGTKALISQRNGGPGGLQGAFQVDNLIRNGKSDEVVKMLERTLKQQFGGRIYTQEEAGQSQQNASQFMRQRSMIKSGAFGNLADTDEKAGRLLEALKQGPGPAIDTLKSGMDATKEVLSNGQKLQESQVNILGEINASMDQMISLQQITALASARNYIGTKNEAMKTSYDQIFDRSIMSIFSQKGESKGLKEQQKDTNISTAANIKDIISIGSSSFKSILNDAKSAAKQSIDAGSEMAHNVKNKAQQSKMISDDIRNSQMAASRGEQMQSSISHAIKNNQPLKHEIVQKPTEIQITVSNDPGMSVEVTSSNPNAVIRQAVTNMSRSGYTNSGGN